MNPLTLVLTGAALLAISGWPGLVSDRRSGWGQGMGLVFSLAGAAAGLGACAWVWAGAGAIQRLEWGWRLPISAEVASSFALMLDPLAVFFLAPIFLMAGLGPMYGLGYWKQSEHPQNGRKLRVFYGLLSAAMAMVVLAADAVVFLVAWEVMALSAFFLVSTEDREPTVRDAGWVYLVATHVGTLALFAMFALLARATGSFALRPVGAAVGLGTVTAVFLLAVLGFGLKAGLIPLHVWLPPAHAAAPSHVSALLSGVLLKMGIYGLVRMIGLLPAPPAWWGALLLILGVVSGVLGVVYAIAQHDIKRLLAYHSIENIGIIVMGLGLAVLGRTLGRGDWVVLGLAGALLHVWNHSLFKALLFLSAGSVVHATGTRQVDELGGLAKSMPMTAGAFAVGAVAICGLPPLNGFVSELLIYLGLFRTLQDNGAGSASAIALAAPMLALIGALALACFVKVFGATFLGTARSAHAAHGHEAPWTMLAPMGVLALACVAIGIAPAVVAPILDQTIAMWGLAPGAAGAWPMRLADTAPLGWISVSSGALWVLVLLGVGWVALWSSARGHRREARTWACGYPGATARMQYTASSFGQGLVGLFSWALRPRTRRPSVAGIFPTASRFESHVGDLVHDRGVLPAFRFLQRQMDRFRFLQQGKVQSYILFLLAALVVMLLWTIPVGALLGRLFK